MASQRVDQNVPDIVLEAVITSSKASGSHIGNEEDRSHRMNIVHDIPTTQTRLETEDPAENGNSFLSYIDTSTHQNIVVGDSPLGDDYEYRAGLDVDSNDTDSAITDILIGQSTYSARSSVYEFVSENGRTYHRYKAGAYMLPNDEQEQERLDLQHHLWLLTLSGKLYLAPISSSQRVLDIGTGTGIWATEFATQNPQAEVIGSDLSPIQPLYVPPNCRFEVEDAEDRWTYSEKFDYIHGRFLFTCFNSPAAVIQQAYDALTPGGYLEMQELNFKVHGVDDTVKGTSLERWSELCSAGGKVLNKDWNCTVKFKQYFIEAGFEDVVEIIFAWPSNTWPKRKEDKMLGLYQMTNVLDGIHAMSAKSFTTGLGWTREELDMFLTDVRKDLKNKTIHAYWPIHVIYGRKAK